MKFALLSVLILISVVPFAFADSHSIPNLTIETADGTSIPSNAASPVLIGDWGT